MNTARIYLDNNATALLLPQAREAVVRALDLPGNPSSVHAEGRAARAVIEKARRQVAQLIGADTTGVIFTSGATEAAATVLTPHFKMGKADLAVGHLYVSAVDHPCILAGGRFESRQVSQIPVDRDGLVDLEALESALAGHDNSTGLAMVCLMRANNETGILQPMGEAAKIAKAHGGIFVVDAVQAVGRIPVDMGELGADFLILSSHKIGGPKGAGALVCAGEIMMPSTLIPGGGQEKGHRSGTENPAAIAGFGAAAEQVLKQLDNCAELVGGLRDRLETDMMHRCADCIVFGASVARLPNTLFFALPGLKAETAQIAFDLEGIAVSAGSACSSGKVGPSHVLAAMGGDAEQGGIRVSIGAETTEEDLAGFLAAFDKINLKRLAMLRETSVTSSGA
jgi:cysteine desulfurase